MAYLSQGVADYSSNLMVSVADKGEALADPSVLSDIRNLLYLVEANVPVELTDIACYGRSQKKKARSSWGYSLEVYVAEAAYFYPLLETIKQAPQSIIAYGVEIGNGGMTYVNGMCTAFPTRPILLGNWKSFDKTIPAWLIRNAFRNLSEAIDWTHVQDVDGNL